MTAWHRRVKVVIAATLVVGASCGIDAFPQPGAAFVRQHDWDVASSVWLKIDTHIHSNFSDGSWTIEALVDEAAKNGCDAVAITDHADDDLRGASEEYFVELRRARRQHPEMIVLAGVEWNVPPHVGDEHITVLVEPTLDEAVMLAEFKDRFDDLHGEPRPAELAIEALQWLNKKCAATRTLAVAAYNHPGRKRDSLESFHEEFVKLRGASPLLIGFEGGVGHQAGNPLGGYDGPVQLEERWDPAAATVGGVWDQLLGQGVDAWAALATSDFHHDQPGGASDYPPGKFSETWVLAPERSARGVLRALQAGSFFGAHGQIVRRAQWTVTTDGLARPAQAGEAIRVAPGVLCRASLQFNVPQWDWQDVANIISSVEIIGVDSSGAHILATFHAPTTGNELGVDFEVPSGGIVVRARGRRDVFQHPDYMFMTNPIRIAVE